MPIDCSRLAEAISATIVVTFCTAVTMPSSVRPGLVDQSRAFGHARDAVLNERLDLFRRRRAAPREAAHFARDHGEPAPLLARARGFHRGIERQQVRLERDLVDHADDVGNLAATPC